jgi:NADH-quinone oxidoreductase subunit C
MADENETPPPDETAKTPPEATAAGDKPPADAPGEPLKGEVSRVSGAGVGASAAPPPAGPAAPPAPKPANPAAAKTATGAEARATPGPAHGAPPAAPAGPSDPAPPAGTPIPAFIEELKAAFPDGVEQLSFWVGDWTVIVSADRLLDIAVQLRDAPGTRFDYLSDVTASDWPPRAKRFDVVYCLFSTTRRERIRLKVRAGEGDPVPSVSRIWPAANWLEREVYDLFGVNFTGHPDLRRILMPEEWQGHPQRKDYPLEGPGELLMENPLDWLKLRTAQDTADIE